MSIEEESKAIIRRIYELVNLKEYDAIYQTWAPGAVIHTSMRDITAEEARQSDDSTAAFSDYRATVENIVAEGDMVAFRVKVTGTHTGEWMGIPPTGKKFSINNAYFARVADGKMAEAWGVFEFSLLRQQLGAIPSQ